MEKEMETTVTVGIMYRLYRKNIGITEKNGNYHIMYWLTVEGFQPAKLNAAIVKQ